MKNRWSSKIIFILILFSCSNYSSFIKQLPSKYRSIYLFNFTNETFEPQIDQELTEAIRVQIHEKNSLILIPHSNRAIYQLSGRVVLFRREAMLYDNLYEPTHYKIETVVEMKLSQKGKMIAKREVYDSIRYSPREGIVENDFQARERLWRRISRKIIFLLEKSIYNHLKNQNIIQQ